jgi:branched-chain amino acid transport system ATP-binding protein
MPISEPDVLAIRDLHVYYGNIHALKGIDLDVEEGEIIAILGPNGAGKSTLIKTIIGVLAQRSGTIAFRGKTIDGTPTAQRIQLGLGTIPEGRQLFTDMTVRENLILGAYARLGMRIAPWLETALGEVFDVFPRLRERQFQDAGSLSGGEAQMVAVGRALMSRPRLLLCDEPSLGLAPLLVREVLATLKRLRDAGITILLADQNALSVLRLADRAYVLDTGRVVAAGPAGELADDDRLREAYLGSGVEAPEPAG